MRAISILATGTVIGQVVSLLTMPIITRLYSPGDYGVLGIYSSIVIVLGSVAGSKFDSAILLPPHTASGEKTVRGLFRLSVVSSVAVSVVLLVVIIFFHYFWGEGPFSSLGSWIFLVPLGVLLTSVSAALSAVATREGAYKQLGILSPVQKISSGGVQIAGGFAGAGVAGLIAGAIAQPVATIGLLIKGRWRFVATSLRRPSEQREILRLASEYRDFPLVSAPTVLLNTLAWNSQVLVLAWLYTPDDVGFYSLAMGVVGLPLNIILSAVSQVYLRESAARKSDRTATKRLFVQLLIGLFVVSIPVFGILALASQVLIEPLFGSEWAAAGLIALSLLPLLWGRFMATTLTTTFTVYRRQVWLLWWQMVTLLVTSLGYVVGGINELAIADTVALASWMSLPLYLLIIPLSYYVMSKGLSIPLPRDGR
ncbi:oligosaccharide flippase family protein [Paeniglutamicibacter sp. ZC-3]|nr:oligosaccharide flippase family protein [Paeniglutamicibacter sp. ZC-3]MCV9996505.1 oligosaccharide flippase family protein [Paeniglutamicibacter sp. ZC-3]